MEATIQMLKNDKNAITTGKIALIFVLLWLLVSFVYVRTNNVIVRNNVITQESVMQWSCDSSSWKNGWNN